MFTLHYMPNTSSVLHLHPTLVPLVFVRSLYSLTCYVDISGFSHLNSDKLGELTSHRRSLTTNLSS